MTTTPHVPAGLDTLREMNAMRDAGVSPEQSEAMLYAAIRASEAYIAEMRNDIDVKIKALDTRIEALDAKIKALNAVR